MDDKPLKLTSTVKREMKLSRGMACDKCGMVMRWLKDLQIHHMNGNSRQSFWWNLTVICNDCHQRQHPKGVTTTTEFRTLEWEESVFSEEWLTAAADTIKHTKRNEIATALRVRLRESHSERGIRIHKRCTLCEKYWSKEKLCNKCPGYASGLCERFVWAVRVGRGREWIQMMMKILNGFLPR